MFILLVALQAGLTLVDDVFDVCFGSPCQQCVTRIPEEISTKMIGDLSNSLELASPTSELLKEDVRLLHNTGQIIHINASALVMSATLLQPNIWFSFAWIESHVHECIGKVFMLSCSLG
jgi:hypothetical protein